MLRNKPEPKSYQNGQIYAIRSYQTDMIYIGSSCTLLSKRLYQHKKEYESQRKYYSSFEILKYDDAYIELLEDYPCNSKRELEKREGELIRQHKQFCVNCNIVGRTAKEYREDNKEEIKEKKKIYFQKNKERIKQNSKYRLAKILCECGDYYMMTHKARHYKSNRHKQELDIFDYTDMITKVEQMTKEFNDYFNCKNSRNGLKTSAIILK